MSKKMRYLLFILVLMVPLVLAACGGDDDKDDGDSSVKLDQSFESVTGASFKYPEGWAAEDVDGQVMIANSAEALETMKASGSDTDGPAAGQVGMIVMAMPLADMGMPEGTTIDSLFGMMVQGMSGEGMETVGDTEELKLGDNDARKQNVKDADSGSDGFIIAFMDGSDAFVMLIGVTAPGETDKFADTGIKIAESIEFKAPAAE